MKKHNHPNRKDYKMVASLAIFVSLVFDSDSAEEMHATQSDRIPSGH